MIDISELKYIQNVCTPIHIIFESHVDTIRMMFMLTTPNQSVDLHVLGLNPIWGILCPLTRHFIKTHPSFTPGVVNLYLIDFSSTAKCSIAS